MKKMLHRSLAGVLAAATLGLSAGAADFTACADRLFDMQLFYGTGQGYDLERVPSRAEASAMLVRLLGGEEEAQTGKYTAPFEDVPAWAKPYVGWLYEHQLTYGVGANQFGSQDPCTAQMMAAFLLRTLGYQEAAGDFTFAEALDFAVQKGVVDCVNREIADFHRDEMVAMSYTALSRPTKKGGETLLAELVSAGAIDGIAAADTLKLFAAHRAYETAVEEAGLQARETETTITLQTGESAAELRTILATDPDEQKMVCKVWEGDAPILILYYEDGMFYQVDANGQTAVPSDYDTVVGKELLPISAVREISEKNNTYTVIADTAPATRWFHAFAESAVLPDGTVEELTTSITLQEGTLSEQRLQTTLNVYGALLSAEYHTVITARGDAVHIEKPQEIQ